ncbi:MAG: glycoside hydrolase family 3 protein [Coprococcus sp.]
MKKLVAVTTVVLVILLIILGSIIVKESVIGDGEKRSSSTSSRDGNSGQSIDDDPDAEWIYDGSLLKMQKQLEVITYEGRDFEVQFVNPFYEEGSDNYINVIFYDENHGYLLRSLGTGTDSEFFEAYKTEDGCQSWHKCSVDVWFDLDGQNHLEMISENELIYIHTIVNESLGINKTSISYSMDGGDSWYAFEGNTGDEDSERILSAIENMPLEEKVAQLFIVSPENLTGVEVVYNTGDATYGALSEYPVGGLVYSKANIDSSYQFRIMLEKAQEYGEELTGFTMFLALTEEGGEDTVLSGNRNLDEYYEYYVDEYDDGEYGDIPSMSAIGRSGDSNAAYEVGKTVGELMNSYGLNMNLAPVADVLSGSNYKMGTRSFGTDAQTVSDMVLEVVRGLDEENIHAVLKYFPGYGAAAANMSGYPVISSSLEELMDREFLPYISAIEQGIDFIMVGHIAVPAVTESQIPASLSEKMIREILRGELGFKGIVMTDYLNDEEIQKDYSSSEAAVMAIQAGADILLEPADFEEAYEGVLEAVSDGTITEERIDESLYRILRVKLSMQEDSETEE